MRARDESEKRKGRNDVIFMSKNRNYYKKQTKQSIKWKIGLPGDFFYHIYIILKKYEWLQKNCQNTSQRVNLWKNE